MCIAIRPNIRQQDDRDASLFDTLGVEDRDAREGMRWSSFAPTDGPVGPSAGSRQRHSREYVLLTRKGAAAVPERAEHPTGRYCETAGWM